ETKYGVFGWAYTDFKSYNSLNNKERYFVARVKKNALNGCV
ncbi:MAG: hypothetical protein ACI9Y1_000837, partial [Lentisphaeria bacterium]